jgi:hypothetical protein
MIEAPDFWRLWYVGLIIATVRWLETVEPHGRPRHRRITPLRSLPSLSEDGRFHLIDFPVEEIKVA